MVAHRVQSAPLGHRRVFELSWPIMVSMLSYTAMGVVDTLFVGQLGTVPLAAVGMAAIASHLGTSFGVGLLRGAKVQVAQATGAGQPDVARRYVWQAVWVAMAMGTLVALLAPFGPAVFAGLGVSDEVGVQASVYFGLRMVAAPLVFLNVGLSAWFQGTGDTRTPMVATLVANALNIVLDPVLIFGWLGVPALGIAGAALATAIGLGAGVLVLGVAVLPELRGTREHLDTELLAGIWRLGHPIGLQYLLEVTVWVAFSSILARAGDAHLAAHVIAVRVISLSFLPGQAVGDAAGVLVGQSLGAGRPAEARRAWWLATQQALAIMVACGIVFVAIPGPLVGVFEPEADVAVIAVQLLCIAAAFQVADAVATVALGALTGAGDTRFVSVVSVGVAWFVNLPASLLLALYADLGAVGAWLGLFAAILAIAGLSLWRMRGEAWLEQPLDHAPLPTA